MLLKSVDPPQLALENQSAGWGCLNLMAGILFINTLPDTAFPNRHCTGGAVHLGLVKK